MASETLGVVADIVMGQSPPGDAVTAEPIGLPLLNGPTEFGTSHPVPVQFTADVRKKAIPGDLLFCVRGSTTGRMNWADREYAIGRGIAAIRHKEDGRVQPFVRAVIECGLSDLLVQATGSTFPNVSASQLAAIPYPEIDINTQRSIAHILGTFDAKVELNRRMNETLEAIARAIFKSWFVDFDPVRAKASGESPESICRRLGLTPELLALFPDRFVESECGEIPGGWGVKPLDGVANYLNGLALQKFPPESETEWLPVIKIAQLKKGDSVGADRASCKLKPEYIVNDGDVLFSWSGSLEVDIWCGGQGALNQHLFKVTSANYPQWFYFYWTKHHLSHFQAVAAGKAVTMGHIQRKHLTEAFCAVPPDSLIEKINDTMAPLLSKQISNRMESRTLGFFRDSLLPKLLSGELRVSNDANINIRKGVAYG